MFWGSRARPVRRADNLTICLDSVESLTSHNPIGLQGLVVAALGTAYNRIGEVPGLTMSYCSVSVSVSVSVSPLFVTGILQGSCTRTARSVTLLPLDVCAVRETVLAVYGMIFLSGPGLTSN
jgi:hypothetical protein